MTADDQFVQQLFERRERRSVAGADFVVHPPANLRGVLAMRARAYRGNRELARSGLAGSDPPPSGLKSVLRSALVPTHAPSVAVYAGVNLLAKGLAYGRPSSTWERDESARQMAAEAWTAPAGPDGSKKAHVCYVTSHYPALSHTFVMREILGLRAAGLEVDTVSVHQADPAHCWQKPTGAKPTKRGTSSPFMRTLLREQMRAPFSPTQLPMSAPLLKH